MDKQDKGTDRNTHLDATFIAIHRLGTYRLTDGRTMQTERWTNRQTEEETDRKTHLDAAFFAVLPQDTQVGWFHAHPVKYRQVAVFQRRQLEPAPTMNTSHHAQGGQ